MQMCFKQFQEGSSFKNLRHVYGGRGMDALALLYFAKILGLHVGYAR